MRASSLSVGPIGLGLGLLSIGRTWGHKPEPPPPEVDARRLLEQAVELGIRFFDTAPAYGSSERILGAFLADIGTRRHDLVVASKMGEHWDEASGSAFTDHTYDALCRSIDRTASLLRQVDVLQVHKATAKVVRSDDVLRAVEYAKALGIHTFGASVSSIEDAEVARETGVYTYLQFPYNQVNTQLEPIFAIASDSNLKIIVNRPYGMGQILNEYPGERKVAMQNALSFIIRQNFQGHILTGTKSSVHLRETVRAYRSALLLV